METRRRHSENARSHIDVDFITDGSQEEAFKYLLFNFQGSSGKEPHGGVAQLGEHLPCKQGVMGSIPIISIDEANQIPFDANGL